MCEDRAEWSRQIRRYNNSPPYVTLRLIALTQGSKRDLIPLFKFLGGACDLNAWKKLPCSTILPPLIGWSTATRIATYLLYLHHSWLKSHESSSSKWLMNYTMCKCECISFMSCLFQSFRQYMLHGNMQPWPTAWTSTSKRVEWQVFRFSKRLNSAFFSANVILKILRNIFLRKLQCPGGPLVFEVGYHPRKKKKSRNQGCLSGPGNVHAYIL